MTQKTPGDGDKDPKEVSSMVTQMSSVLTGAHDEYNEVVKAAAKLEKENQAAKNKNLVVSAYRTTLMNRYHAVQSWDKLLFPATQGFYWGWYFAFNPDLDKDVQKAGKVWLVNAIWPTWTIAGIYAALKATPKVVATGAFTTQADVDRLKKAAKEKVELEVQSVALSTGAGISIGRMLKTVGSYAKTDTQKFLAKSVRGTWAVTGVMALLYGFGKIHDAMGQTNGFDGPLKVQRDKFIEKEKAKVAKHLEYINEASGPGDDFGW